MTLEELRALWRQDWQAMKDGTYQAPLPHPSRTIGPNWDAKPQLSPDAVNNAGRAFAVLALVMMTGVVW